MICRYERESLVHQPASKVVVLNLRNESKYENERKKHLRVTQSHGMGRTIIFEKQYTDDNKYKGPVDVQLAGDSKGEETRPVVEEGGVEAVEVVAKQEDGIEPMVPEWFTLGRYPSLRPAIC